MIKKLTITMALFAFNFSFSWDYIGQKGTGNGGDFEIASNNDIYMLPNMMQDFLEVIFY